MSHKYQQSYDAGTNYYQVPGGSQLHLNEAYPPNQTFAAAKSGHNKWYQSPWVKYGVPAILVIAIAGGVGGGIAASRSNNDDSASSAANRGVSNNAAGPLATNSNGNPVYSSTAAAAAPAATATRLSALCSADNPSYSVQAGDYQIRADHPRLFGSSSKWSCLPQQIAQDPYLRSWNATIFANATRFAAQSPVPYTPDGGLSGSGVLDVAREMQLRIKHWAYAYRLSNDSSWVERTWQELLVASGNSSQSFGTAPDRWNTAHFLDLAEFTAAFAYAYDWMYDAWSNDQRNAIMWSILNLGLNYGINSYEGETGYGWWQTTNGNWNCVCNGGLTMGALAIAGDDPTGTAGRILGHTIPNARANCAQAVQPDGTWSETSDYWYFGSTTAAQMAAALRTSTGSTQNLFQSNSNYNKTGLFHMYGTGFTYKFNYGDCGPNKYTATANSMMFFGDVFDTPVYSLFQRDRSDAPEPLAMMYYNPDLSGDWWYNLPLDHHFDAPNNDWTAMRSSWTDSNGLYAAMKAGNNTGHQNHNMLDAGDFVIDALGQRWAGKLCQDNYLSPGYFSGDVQDRDRWTYYRCMTQGQNTILVGNKNQNLLISPPTTYDTTGDEQTSLNFNAASSSAVYWHTDMSEAYNSTVRRGMRLLNARRQVLIQDEIESDQTSQWRMHTNATVSLSNGDRTATLALGGETLIATILDSAPSLTFATSDATRLSGSGSPPGNTQDLPNPGVTVLSINIPTGSTTLQVLFNPQWSGLSSSDYKTPSSVALSSWSLTSHN